MARASITAQGQSRCHALHSLSQRFVILGCWDSPQSRWEIQSYHLVVIFARVFAQQLLIVNIPAEAIGGSHLALPQLALREWSSSTSSLSKSPLPLGAEHHGERASISKHFLSPWLQRSSQLDQAASIEGPAVEQSPLTTIDVFLERNGASGTVLGRVK